MSLPKLSRPLPTAQPSQVLEPTAQHPDLQTTHGCHDEEAPSHTKALAGDEPAGLPGFRGRFTAGMRHGGEGHIISKMGR